MSDKLPYVDLKNWQGLFTKSSPEVLQAEQLRIAENCDFFERYGAICKIKGNSRVLSTPYTEGAVVQNIPWIGFYKAPDLDGTILRHTLVSAGSILGRIDGNSITPLRTGRSKNLFHSSDSLERLMYITNQNPDKVGEGDELVKYDGATITKWGVAAPGADESIQEAFDDAAAWTTFNATLTDQDETQITFDGDSVRVDKTSTNLSEKFLLEKEHANPFYFIPDPQHPSGTRGSDKAVSNRIRFLTYIPRGQLCDTLQQKPAMSVYISPDAATVQNNYWQYDFPIGSFVEGWNLFQLDTTDNPPGSTTGAPSGDFRGSFYPEVEVIRRTRWEFYLQTAQTTMSGLRMDKYHTLDQGAPIAIPTGTGSLTGTYSYKVIYVSKFGQFSNAGPQSVNITAANNGSIELSRIPVSPDPQVTKRRIYRTVANGSIWLFLDEIEDNITTTYTDTTPDGSLGNETPPQAGDFSDDNSVPPQAGIAKVWKRTMFLAGDPQNPNTLYFSDDDEPESFPLINVFELDGKITAMYETYSGLVVETETGKWQVIGDNPDFSVDKIVEGMGCVGRRAAGTARLIGWATDRDGMRLFDLSNTKKISEPIRDKFDTDIDKVNIELMHTAHSKSRNVILQFNPDSTTYDPIAGTLPNYNSIFAYIYAIDNVETGFWTEIKTGTANINFLDAVEIEDSNGDFKLYASGADGMVYQLFDGASKNWVDANGTEHAIKTKFQTPYLREGELGLETQLATGRVDPKKMELRADGDAATWNIKIETADGVDQTLARSSSDIEMQFGLNNSLIRQGIPSCDITSAEYFRLTFENNELNVASKILGARLFFGVQEGQFEVIDVDNVIV